MKTILIKEKDTVRATVKPYTGQMGTVVNVDGYYIMVRLKGNKHLTELYPNELEIIKSF